nr:hypothetical protein Iba_chr10cCG10040 [Ipomoea batatas]
MDANEFRTQINYLKTIVYRILPLLSRQCKFQFDVDFFSCINVIIKRITYYHNFFHLRQLREGVETVQCNWLA